jgi:hypothetical protein
VFISNNPDKTITALQEELIEHVGYQISKDIIHTMEKMDFEEIVKFKESLEDLLAVIHVGKIYH